MSYKIREPEMWDKDEVSTRNCFNCKVYADSSYLTVKCGVGHELKAQYNGVVCLPKLLKACINCPDFDNDWR
jgi:hypothetical protein